MEASTGKFTAFKKNCSDVEMEGNRIYIATQNGLLKYDMASKQFQPTALTKKMPGKVETIYIDKGENIWLLIARNGYYCYSTNKNTAFYYNSQDWPMCIYQDKKEAYYMGTWGSGFKVFSKITDEQRKENFSLKFSEMMLHPYSIVLPAPRTRQCCCTYSANFLHILK